MSKFKYITVLDFEKGQVYLYDYDTYSLADAEDFVSYRHNLKNVEYMVHRYTPALWTKDLYYCNREQAYSLNSEE